MQIPEVMTVIGHDRPGLVDLVASLVAEHGGNWLESRMCRLGGEFAGILRVHVPAEQEAALRQSLQSLSSEGLTVVICADREAPAAGPGRLAALEIVGQDRPGIVRQISHALAGQGVNVEELRTECVSAPMSGETLFKARAKLGIPAACDVDGLRRDLERIAGDMLVDIAFDELRAGAPAEC
jgi:glycine cleavage system regulatory protein